MKQHSKLSWKGPAISWFLQLYPNACLKKIRQDYVYNIFHDHETHQDPHDPAEGLTDSPAVCLESVFWPVSLEALDYLWDNFNKQYQEQFKVAGITFSSFLRTKF